MDRENSRIGMKGAKKAALLLMSLGKEEAAKVMSHLDDKMIEEVILEMSKIRSVSKIEKESILAEFRETLMEIKGESKGGIETAKEILSKSLGHQKAEEILRKVDRKEISNEFEFLNDVEPKVIFSLIGSEAPQTIAITLAYLTPKVAADVMKLFPPEQRATVAYKLATTSKTQPEAVAQIARALKKRYDSRDSSEYSEAGGAQSLANILNFLDKEVEEGILKNLTEDSPEIANQVKEKLYVFEDILNLDAKEMRTLLGKIPNEILTFALRGAGDELKKHFFSSMSQNRASDIIEEMELRGKVTIREISQARTELLKIARRLEEQDLILIKKKKDEFI
jgi:flagellar motor switch protein FliG